MISTGLGGCKLAQGADLRHFNGLAALRAVAALIVVVGHVELLKYRSHLPTIWGNPEAFWPDGHFAVVLFFALSGFLISYILVAEKEATGRIVLSTFYMRRVLRIWPLYYFIILLSVLFVHVKHDTTAIVLTLTISPNLALAIGDEWTSSFQIWSIGVEEQFYLLLPLLVRNIRVRKLPLVMAFFFVGYTLLPHVIGYINVRTIQSDLIEVVYRFFRGSKFNSMSVGCLLGTMVAARQRGDKSWDRILACLYWKPLAYAAILLSFILWFGQVRFGRVTDEVYSILFGIMILNVATNTSLKLSLERAPVQLLGNISYGIYMYHWLVILFILKVLPYGAFPTDFVYNISLYGAVLGVTIGVAWISFVTLERYFLNKKVAFSGI